MEAALIVAYILFAGSMLLIGDRLGWYAGCALYRRCAGRPLPLLPKYVHIPVALAVPATVLAGIVASVVFTAGNPLELLADHLELLVLVAFFVTGTIGGLLARIAHS